MRHVSKHTCVEVEILHFHHAFHSQLVPDARWNPKCSPARNYPGPVRSGSHSEAGHGAEQLTSLMKMGLNVVRVRERLAQGNDRPRIGEVLLDPSNYFSLAHLNTFLSHLRWRAALDRLYRSIQLRDRRRRALPSATWRNHERGATSLRLFVCMKTRTDGRSCCAHQGASIALDELRRQILQ